MKLYCATCLRTDDQWLELKPIHDQYGNLVRIYKHKRCQEKLALTVRSTMAAT